MDLQYSRVRFRSSPLRLFSLCVAGQFLFGLVLALPGTLFGIPAWTAALGFDIAAQGRLLVLFFAGQFVCTAIAGTLVDRLGAERVLAVGCVLMGVAFALLGEAATAGVALSAAAVLASGGAAINASTNTLVSATFGDRRGSMLSLMATFGAAGALSAPLLFRGGFDPAQVASRLWSLAVVTTIVAVLPLVVVPASRQRLGEPIGRTVALLRERPLVGLIALLALEFGNEAVLAGWTAAYAIAVLPGANGGLMIALYWGGLCLGRIMAPLLLARLAKLIVVLGSALVVAAAVAGMATARDEIMLGLAAFVAGLGVGPLAPTIVSVAADRYPHRMGAAIGVLLSMAQIGGMVLPWMTARTTIAFGYRAGLVVPILGACGIAIGTALAWRSRAGRVPATAPQRS